MDVAEALAVIGKFEISGPRPDQYNSADKAFEVLNLNRYGAKDLARDYAVIAASFSDRDCMHGHVCQTPYGYHGDFEIIDKIYRSQHSEIYVGWDEYFHAGTASRAVRGRKTFFAQLLRDAVSEKTDLRVLNVASGPARDVAEFLMETQTSTAAFDCIDADENALNYAKTICRSKNVEFIHANAFKYRTDKKYDLIWSAGLFDYLDDRLVQLLLKKLFRFLSEYGSVVIGNFNERNIQRHYMEFGGWKLYHRSEAHMVALLVAAVEDVDVTVEHEENQVNAFYRVKKRMRVNNHPG